MLSSPKMSQHKMKTKTITLASGTEEEGFSWDIRTIIKDNGICHTKGVLETRNTKDYYEKHKRKILKQQKTSKGKEVKIRATKRYRQTEKGKIVHSKIDAKHRELGFIPINAWFEGSESHHIDKEHVIYIPEEIHGLMYHNIWTGAEYG